MTKRALTTRPKDRDNEALDLRTNLQKKTQDNGMVQSYRKHVYTYTSYCICKYTYIIYIYTVYIHKIYIYVYVYVDMENVMDNCCKETSTNQ